MKAEFLFRCPLCGKKSALLTDRKSRPYFRCDSCLMRIFAPVEPGASRLLKVCEKVQSKEVVSRGK